MTWYYLNGPRQGQPYSAQRTLRAVLADATLMATNQRVQSLIDTEVQRISEEVGLTADDLIELPVLFWEIENDRMAAYMPGTVNMLFYGRTAVMARPHGVFDGDIDIVEQANIEALAPYGVTARFVEQWDILHAAEGEVHCGTNALRRVPARWQWWETVR
jgi:protein-arginine deiminase